MSTTLNGAILSTDTTITVVSTSGFAASGIILIDNEEVSYGAISGNQFTGCTRGVDNTNAVGHNSGVTVSQVVASAGWVTDSLTIPSTSDSTTRKSYTVDSLTFGAIAQSHVRIITSGIVVPPKNAGASTAKGGGAFGSNALDYTMRGFHVQLNQIVTWKAPFNDASATQFFGNGGTPGTITNIVVLSRK